MKRETKMTYLFLEQYSARKSISLIKKYFKNKFQKTLNMYLLIHFPIFNLLTDERNTTKENKICKRLSVRKNSLLEYVIRPL